MWGFLGDLCSTNIYMNVLFYYIEDIDTICYSFCFLNSSPLDAAIPPYKSTLYTIGIYQYVCLCKCNITQRLYVTHYAR